MEKDALTWTIPASERTPKRVVFVGGISKTVPSSLPREITLFELSDVDILARMIIYFNDAALGGSSRYIPRISAKRAIKDFNANRTDEAVGKIQFDAKGRKENTDIRSKRLYSYHRFMHDEYDSHAGP